jgi:MFS transporter, ACS family, glucarate transporter
VRRGVLAYDTTDTGANWIRMHETAPAQSPDGLTGLAPGYVRYRVVAFTVALAGITYLDRICIATVAPSIMHDLSLTRLQMSYVFSAFAIAYASFEIPSAWWGQKVGTRRVLTRIVAWWSTFTIATGLATTYPVMLATRFLFGIGEAGAWPNVARTFSRWIPASERGRAQGFFFAGAFLFGGLTPIVIRKLEPLVGWRGVFFCCGSLGFLWAAAWYWWFRDEPSQHPSVSRAELALIEEGRQGAGGGDHHADSATMLALAGSPSAWALCLSYFSNSWGSYFAMTWLPAYLAEQRGFKGSELALFAGLPLLLAVFGGLFGGVATDYVTKRFGMRLGRSGVGGTAYVIAAVALFAASLEADAFRAAVLIAIAVATSMLSLGSHWAAAIDIGRENAGVLSACMNTVGQVGSIISPIAVAFLVDQYHDWALPLQVLAGLYVFSALCWLVVQPSDHVQVKINA